MATTKAYTSKELVQMRNRIASMDRRKRFASGRNTYIMRWWLLDDETADHSLKLNGSDVNVDTLPLPVADAYIALRRRLTAWADGDATWPMNGTVDSGEPDKTEKKEPAPHTRGTKERRARRRNGGPGVVPRLPRRGPGDRRRPWLGPLKASTKS